MAAIVAGNGWSTAVPDWEARIRKGLSLIPDLPLFSASREKALRVFRRLRAPDVMGTPTLGEICEPWVFDFVGAVFGSYNPETRVRMIREFFLMIPKKNGKSLISAGIILTAAILNERPENELALIAPTMKIAGIALKTIKGMIRLDPALGGPTGDGKEGGIFQVGGDGVITHRGTLATIQIFAADGDVVTGGKLGFVLVDESHVLGAKTKAPDVFLELRGGLDSKPEGFFLQITTQSKDRPVGQFEAELNTARAVRDGKLDLPLLAVLYEFPEAWQKSKRWEDPALWHLVNPNLGISTHLQTLKERLLKAQNEGLEAVAKFASQYLNVQIGIGLKSGRWAGADHWLGAAVEGLTLEEILASSEVVVGGLDGGGLDDLLSLCVMGRHKESGVWQVWCKAWADRAILELRNKIAPELLELERLGELVFVDDLETAADEIADLCARIRDLGLFPEERGLGFDAYGVTSILDALALVGMGVEHVAAVGQGYKLKGAIQAAPVRLKSRSLVHGGQRLMTWAVGNAKVQATAASVLMSKAEAGSGKIDPVIALLNAFQLMALHPKAAGKKGDLSGFLASDPGVI